MYNSIELEVKKWGNSLGIRIPRALAEILNIEAGSRIRLTLKEDRVELHTLDPEGRPVIPLEAFASEDDSPEPEAVEVLEEAEDEDDVASEGSGHEEDEEQPRKRRKPRKRVKGRRFFSLEKLNLLRLPDFDKPNYNLRPRGRTSPISLGESSMDAVLKGYPFVVVVFWDFLYVDFLENFRRKLHFLRALARIFSGHCWFVMVNVDRYPDLRRRFIGNAWSELEIIGFINGKKTFEGYSLGPLLPVLQWVSGHYLEREKIEELEILLKAPSREQIRTEEELQELQREHEQLVIALIKPQDRGFLGKLGKALVMSDLDITVVNCYDFAYYDEKTSSFRENALLKHLLKEQELKTLPALVLFRQVHLDEELEAIQEGAVDGGLSISKIGEELKRFFEKEL